MDLKSCFLCKAFVTVMAGKGFFTGMASFVRFQNREIRKSWTKHQIRFPKESFKIMPETFSTYFTPMSPIKSSTAVYGRKRGRWRCGEYFCFRKGILVAVYINWRDRRIHGGRRRRRDFGEFTKHWAIFASQRSLITNHFNGCTRFLGILNVFAFQSVQKQSLITNNFYKLAYSL